MLPSTKITWPDAAENEEKEYQPLTEAEFARRISISEFNMNPDGDFTAKPAKLARRHALVQNIGKGKPKNSAKFGPYH